MIKFHRLCLGFLFSLPILAFSQQTSYPLDTPAPPSSAQADPVLKHRPAAIPIKAIPTEGRIHLDVVVTDSQDKPVLNLDPWDFKLLDNDQPRKILSFHAYNGNTTRPDPPVEAFLLLDMLNLPFQQFAFVRAEVEKFLRQNGGHLPIPVSIMLLTEDGIRVQPRPSLDGNALLGVVDGVKEKINSINPAMGAEGDLTRFQRSVHQLANIAESEANRPGRKLLIWVGPGWPMLDSAQVSFSEKGKRQNFDGIVELSTKLREARIALYSVSPTNTGLGATADRRFLYQEFLNGVTSPAQADVGNLALKVLVTQSGGRIYGPDNNLAAQIDRCIADANRFYRISFEPPAAHQANEFHALKALVNQPGLTARTNTGYYNQP